MEPVVLCSPSRARALLLSAATSAAFSIYGASRRRSSPSSVSCEALRRRRSPLTGGPSEHPLSNTPALFPSLLPVLRYVRGWRRLARRCLRGGLEGQGIGGKDVVCSGGLGTLLLSTTAAALTRARASPFLATLAANPTFVSGVMAWALAQAMKVFINFFLERRWDPAMLLSCGGMPSSHSALCTALTASVALCHGVGDSLFPVCLGFSLIVMYDATGVRRHAGMQAAVLNMIVEDLFQGHPISQRKLKELLGHTPSQVLAGALLGVLVACVCCQAILVI